ncbi:MAG: O-antigen polysaccharide polymerase Wzy family protein [Prevotellaceae bacterium]|jgi:hypothetical protein|nr:O-antigen polysaccharide polymerase Wzy family protein [Prevotellaceae bacterium]
MKIKNAWIAQCVLAFVQAIVFLLPLSIELYKVNLLLIFAYTVGCALYMRVPFYHPYILFLCTFFLFMLSRVLLDVLGGVYFAENSSFIDYTFSAAVQLRLLLVLSISLLAIHFGAIFAFAKTQKYQKNTPNKQKYLQPIRKIALILFYGMLVPYFIRILTVVLYVKDHGYMAMYTGGERIISNPILAISDDICTMGFYLFLATFPHRKALKMPTAIFITLIIISLGMGFRGSALTQIFVLIAYSGLRGVINKKRFVLAMVCMVMLSQFAFLFRMGATPSIESLQTYTKDFFYNQGASITVVGLCIQEEENLKEVSIFAPLLHIARNSVGAKLVGYRPPQAPSKEYALHSRELGDILAYKTNKEIYLAGGGMGGALVAEFYLWAGYFGVFIGCLLFVYVILYLFERYKYSVYGMFLLFYTLPEFFFSPRSSPLLILNYIIRPAIFLIFLHLFIQYGQKLKSSKSTNN